MSEKFQVYFKHYDGRYHWGFYVYSAFDALTVCSEYGAVIPEIMICDSLDYSVIEVKEGILQHPVEEMAAFEKHKLEVEQWVSPKDLPQAEKYVQDLVDKSKSLISEYIAECPSYNGLPPKEYNHPLNANERNLLAACARFNIKLSDYLYRNKDVVLTELNEGLNPTNYQRFLY